MLKTHHKEGAVLLQKKQPKQPTETPKKSLYTLEEGRLCGSTTKEHKMLMKEALLMPKKGRATFNAENAGIKERPE